MEIFVKGGGGKSNQIFFYWRDPLFVDIAGFMKTVHSVQNLLIIITHPSIPQWMRGFRKHTVLCSEKGRNDFKSFDKYFFSLSFSQIGDLVSCTWYTYLDRRNHITGSMRFFRRGGEVLFYLEGGGGFEYFNKYLLFFLN